MKDLVLKACENYSLGDLEGVIEYLNENLVLNIVGDKMIAGAEEVVEYCEEIEEESQAEFKIVQSYLCDDTVIIEGVCHETKEEDEEGIYEFCDIFKIKDGKIVKIKSYFI